MPEAGGYVVVVSKICVSAELRGWGAEAAVIRGWWPPGPASARPGVSALSALHGPGPRFLAKAGPGRYNLRVNPREDRALINVKMTTL